MLSASDLICLQCPVEEDELPGSTQLRDSAYKLVMVMAVEDEHSSSPPVMRCHRAREEPQVAFLARPYQGRFNQNFDMLAPLQRSSCLCWAITAEACRQLRPPNAQHS